jgi:protein-tyrosine phosphatase
MMLRTLVVFLFFSISLQAQVVDSLQRKVFLTGAHNFRDLGGYKTADGGRVKWGRVYRSADLSKLTPEDLTQLADRKIKVVVDFRGPIEIKQAPDKLPAGAKYVNLPAGSGQVNPNSVFLKLKTAADTDSMMRSFYGLNDSLAFRYKPFFAELVKAEEGTNVLFHCTAGKDRTGMGAALLLTALGVSKDQVIADFLASNYYRQDENRKMIPRLKSMGFTEEMVLDLMGVKESYLQVTFQTIEKKYGSIEKYLEVELGVGKTEISKLKQLYIEKF